MFFLAYNSIYYHRAGPGLEGECVHPCLLGLYLGIAGEEKSNVYVSCLLL